MSRRSYNQYCGVARSLDVVGERWTLLMVRNLLLGPLRYSDLLRGLPGITTNLLAKRLKEMEDARLLERIRGSAPDGGRAWRLTDLGEALEPAVQALASWGWQGMKESRRGEMRSFEFLLVALRRNYRGGAVLRAELVVDDVPYSIVLAKKSAEISRGSMASPDLRIRGKGAAVARLFLDRSSSDRAQGSCDVEGTAASLDTLVSAFATEQFSFALPTGGASTTGRATGRKS